MEILMKFTILVSLFALSAFGQHASAASSFDGVAGEYVAKNRSCDTGNGRYEGVRVSASGNKLGATALVGTALQPDGSLFSDNAFDLSQAKQRYTTDRAGDLIDIWKEAKGGTVTRWQRGCLGGVSFWSCGKWHQTFQLKVVSPREIKVSVWNYTCELEKR
jgi:hypothetical protein